MNGVEDRERYLNGIERNFIKLYSSTGNKVPEGQFYITLNGIFIDLRTHGLMSFAEVTDVLINADVELESRAGESSHFLYRRGWIRVDNSIGAFIALTDDEPTEEQYFALSEALTTMPKEIQVVYPDSVEFYENEAPEQILKEIRHWFCIPF